MNIEDHEAQIEELINSLKGHAANTEQVHIDANSHKCWNPAHRGLEFAGLV